MTKKYTYFVGMRITTNNANMRANPDAGISSVLPYQRTEIFGDGTSPNNPNVVN